MTIGTQPNFIVVGKCELQRKWPASVNVSLASQKIIHQKLQKLIFNLVLCIPPTTLGTAAQCCVAPISTCDNTEGKPEDYSYKRVFYCPGLYDQPTTDTITCAVSLGCTYKKGTKLLKQISSNLAHWHHSFPSVCVRHVIQQVRRRNVVWATKDVAKLKRMSVTEKAGCLIHSIKKW